MLGMGGGWFGPPKHPPLPLSENSIVVLVQQEDSLKVLL